jgi:DNA-binding XRE family transcriptional regulator
MTAEANVVLPAPLPTSAASLIAWRKQMKLTKANAAIALGCSRNALMLWEAGANEVPPYIGLAMAALAAEPPLPPYRPRSRRSASPGLAPG